jgi:hypothetical protein
MEDDLFWPCVAASHTYVFFCLGCGTVFKPRLYIQRRVTVLLYYNSTRAASAQVILFFILPNFSKKKNNYFYVENFENSINVVIRQPDMNPCPV